MKNHTSTEKLMMVDSRYARIKTIVMIEQPLYIYDKFNQHSDNNNTCNNRTNPDRPSNKSDNQD